MRGSPARRLVCIICHFLNTSLAQIAVAVSVAPLASLVHAVRTRVSCGTRRRRLDEEGDLGGGGVKHHVRGTIKTENYVT